MCRIFYIGFLQEIGFSWDFYLGTSVAIIQLYSLCYMIILKCEANDDWLFRVMLFNFLVIGSFFWLVCKLVLLGLEHF